MRMLVMLAYLSLMPISSSVGAADLLSICTEAEEPRGALAMMHGRSFQPNRSDGLAEQGL